MNSGGVVMILAGVWVLAQILRGGLLERIGVTGSTVPVNTNDPRTGTPMPPNIPGQITTGGTIGSGDVGRSGRAPA